MNFLRKNANEFQSGYTGYYLKPATCPHCGVGTDAVATAREIFAYSGSSNLLLSAAKCTGCHKTFFYANLRESGNSDAEMVCIYPDRKLDYKNETLEKVRFLLENVVQNGTGKNASSKYFPVAGKTGTAQLSQGAGGSMNSGNRPKK